jgi:branched-chain amino acid transport system ATP-binding protein
MSHLQVEQVSKHFGGVRAVDNVTLEVQPGERYALIGPNGAGKSTLFNLISGELPVTHGTILLDGQDITRTSVYDCANLGIGRTFQRNNLFLGMTAHENVRLAVQHQHRVARQFFRKITDFNEITQEADRRLSMVGLGPVRNKKTSEMAYGQQRALEIALALATNPKILLLDEPTAGMSPAETANMVTLIQSLPPELTIMIVEHDMDVIFTLADRVTVLHYGEVIATGKPQEIREDQKVREIYLGTVPDAPLTH